MALLNKGHSLCHLPFVCPVAFDWRSMPLVRLSRSLRSNGVWWVLSLGQLFPLEWKCLMGWVRFQKESQVGQRWPRMAIVRHSRYKKKSGAFKALSSLTNQVAKNHRFRRAPGEMHLGRIRSQVTLNQLVLEEWMPVERRIYDFEFAIEELDPRR